MTTTKKCPSCGRPLAENGLGGNCPRCLMKLAQASPAGEPGRWLGDYELLRQIGRSGMGVVYEALQIGLSRKVALKVIPPTAVPSSTLLDRFRLEAQVVARLDHPNIVPIYEVGEEDNQPYYSMKLIEGRSLELCIHETSASTTPPQPQPESGPAWRTPPGAARLLTTLARAVHHAHQHGVLHRDIKPGNILLDPKGEPHLADFGLAKILQQEGGLTLARDVLGTPSYMAPELADPKKNPVTTAADVYSLGAVLYALLTLRPPFLADTPLNTLELVRSREPVPPRKLNPAIPADLETICLKCLQKDPARRYDSAGGLADDLERFLRDEPITARPVSVMEKTWRWCRRKPLLAGLLGALFLSTAGGGYGVFAQWQRAERLKVPPELKSQLQNLNLRAGDTARFAIAAFGREPLTFRWYHNKTNLVPGATGNVLSLPNVQVAQAGAYHVVVSNVHGTVASPPAMLQVAPASAFTLEGRWPGFPRGLPTGMLVEGHLAYLTMGVGGVAILDFSDPAAPKMIGSCDTPGDAHAVAVKDMLAYVADGPAGLLVLDVSDPRQPSSLGHFATGGLTTDVAREGSHLYVAAGAAGLQIFDLADPSNPLRVAKFQAGDNTFSVQAAIGIAYVYCPKEGARAIDVRDPANPALLSRFGSDLPVKDMRLGGSHTYIAAGGAALQVYDFTNPAKPALLSSLHAGGRMDGLAGTSNTVYAACGSAGLKVIDVSNPAKPVVVGGAKVRGWVYGVRLQDDLALVVDMPMEADQFVGLEIFSVREPTRPEKLGEFNTGGMAGKVQVIGQTGFVADGLNGLEIIDVTRPAQPARIGSYDTDAYSWDVQVVGPHACVADGFGGLKVFDIGDPARPRLLGTHPTPAWAVGVELLGRNAFVAVHRAGLEIVDISRPERPALVGSCRTSGEAWALAISGAYAYLADGPGGFTVLDVSDPARPRRLASRPTGTSALGVAFAGSHAFVADRYRGLLVFDVSDPSQPRRVAEVPVKGQSTCIKISGPHLYLTASAGGVYVFNISNPALPVQTGHYQTDRGAWGIDLVGSQVYVASCEGGLLILRSALSEAAPPQRPFPRSEVRGQRSGDGREPVGSNQ